MAKLNSNANTNENVSKSGRKGYSNAKRNARRDQRRADAEARQLRYDKLTVKEKIALAQSRRGESKREIARLTKKS